MRLFLFTFITLSFISTITHAQEAVKKTHYYDISGYSLKDLRSAMNKKGPADPNHGGRVWAKTKWYVNWTYNYKKVGSKCAIESVDTKTTIDFTLPKWLNKNKAPRSAQKRWDNFYSTLITHENKHGRHGLLAAAEIRKKAPKIKPQKTCKQAKSAARAISKQIIKKYNDMDVAYDRETRNGATEGITLP